MLKITLKILTVTSVVFILTSCSNAELDSCKDKASKLWDSSSNASKADNKAYWDAMKRCETKYK